MGNFELIEKIRKSEGLGVVEFLTKAGISKGAYYAIRDGRTESINQGTITKLKSNWPDHPYHLFNSDDEIEQTKNYEEILLGIPEDEILIHLSKYREKRFEGRQLFEALKRIINQEYEITFLRDKYSELYNKSKSPKD